MFPRALKGLLEETPQIREGFLKEVVLELRAVR